MIDCKLKQIHRVKHSIPITINPQTHRYDELVYFISGNGTTSINGKNNNYKSGCFAFYKMGTVHDEVNPVPCDIIWLHFSHNIQSINLKEGVFTDNNGVLLTLLKKLRQFSVEQKNHSQLLIESCLAEIVVTVEQLQNTPTPINTRLNIEKIVNYIDQNINEHIDFAAIAKDNNYSYDRFRHIFSDHFGISPHSYLTLQRIEYAKRLLKNSDLSITDVAFNCGFNSSSQFTNIFKKHIGVTPKEYKNSITKQQLP